MSDNGSSTGLSTGKAVLFGSFIIACGIVAAALVLPDRPDPAPTPVATTAAPPSEAPAPQKPTDEMQTAGKQEPGAPGRYQITKVENGVSWRLDTQTGELTACRMERDRLICAKSTDATTLPPTSPEALAEERAERDRDRREEKTRMFDQFFAFFERIIRFAEKQAEKMDPDAAEPPKDGEPLKL